MQKAISHQPATSLVKVWTDWKIRRAKIKKDVAFVELFSEAVAGEPTAQFAIAESYRLGRDIPQSDCAASYWMSKAARNGHTGAMAQMSKLALKGAGTDGTGTGPFGPIRNRPDVNVAMNWARLAADAGEAEGQAVLATLLSGDHPGIEDLSAAYALFRKAVAGGSSSGCLGLALLLARKNIDDGGQAEVKSLIERAAADGLMMAIYLDGVALEFGFGCLVDPAGALARYRRAAESGMRPAMTRLGLAHVASGKIVDAETWLRRAALLGDGRAAVCVSNILGSPGNLPPNYLEAAMWAKRGADAGDSGAAKLTGYLHIVGLGCKQDLQEARRWFTHARNLNTARPRREPAALIPSLRNRLRITNDIERWFMAEAKAGDLIAAYRLGACIAIGLEGKPANLAGARKWLSIAASTVPAARTLLDDMVVVSQDGDPLRAAA